MTASPQESDAALRLVPTLVYDGQNISDSIRNAAFTNVANQLVGMGWTSPQITSWAIAISGLHMFLDTLSQGTSYG